ncbi:hypothetical protein [Gordonia neofelifaecis]|uniref:Uncharacterized protein n=1 Tax=Gordonia neofelifaecis NRRL B-59395 TaxID=644548 RepID=F1YE64_9ACTN|nr:hypothetical protein [Gordonia neofelifaecis]EGD57154.1 hypothetical protein SCNU_02230 [Gordonia neofelifaecis NRRL B-59395]
MPDEYEEIEIYEQPDGSYVDADGNPVDENGEPITIESAATPTPAAQPPAVGDTPAVPKVGKAPKLLIAGAAAVVLLVGGGIAWGLSAVGDQNTVSDVKDAAAAKSSQVRAAASSKKEEVKQSVDACSDLAGAAWTGSTEPMLQLKVTDSVTLPSGFAGRLEKADEVVILQTAKTTWGLYIAEPAPAKGAPAGDPWWKATVDTAKGLHVTEGPGDGTDENVAGACKQGVAGPYRVVGEGIPENARGLKDDQVEVAAVQADGGSETGVLAVIGDKVVKADLEAAPADEKEKEEAEK